MQGQTTINNQTSQAINEIKNTLSALTASLRTQEKGKFPAQPQPNPSSQCNITSSDTQSENANSITTLRSGKTVDKTISPKEPESNSQPQGDGKDNGK